MMFRSFAEQEATNNGGQKQHKRERGERFDDTSNRDLARLASGDAVLELELVPALTDNHGSIARVCTDEISVAGPRACRAGLAVRLLATSRVRRNEPRSGRRPRGKLLARCVQRQRMLGIDQNQSNPRDENPVGNVLNQYAFVTNRDVRSPQGEERVRGQKDSSGVHPQQTMIAAEKRDHDENDAQRPQSHRHHAVESGMNRRLVTLHTSIFTSRTVRITR